MFAAASHRYLLPVVPSRVLLPARSAAAEARDLARRRSLAPRLARIVRFPSAPDAAPAGAAVPAAARVMARVMARSRSVAVAAVCVGLLLAVVALGAWSAARRELVAARAELGAARLAWQEAERTVQRRGGPWAQPPAVPRDAPSRAELSALRRELTARLTALSEAQQEPGSAQDAARLAFAGARGALLYVRTTYTLRLVETGEEREQHSFGTGFVASADGLALTAQHVLYPWRFDRTLLASQSLGLLEVLEHRTRVSVWPADAQVRADGSDDAEPLQEPAWRSDGPHASLRILHVGAGEPVEELVMTPAGPTVVSRAEPGPGDLAVLQLLPTGARLPHLPLAEDGPPAPLDEVLALGFPLSRLEDGRAVPQVTLGRVRRSGGPMLELDGALHPGNSGGPILDLQGRVLGMASAILDSPVYGIAVRAAALRAALGAARERTADLQRSLRALGCDPGAADGRLGPRTLQAERCAAALH